MTVMRMATLKLYYVVRRRFKLQRYYLRFALPVGVRLQCNGATSVTVLYTELMTRSFL